MSKHPLADYVRILARGKNASRNMTHDEAHFTMQGFLRDDARPEQIGAVFMLLRVLEETSDDIAGFASAINEYWPAGAEKYDLVWSSYAGKRRQPMWWVLSALLLRDMGFKILVHGTLAHTEGRIYAHEVFNELELPSLTRAEVATNQAGLAYLPCSEIHPSLQEWLSLKDILGVRSPINTVLKTISPAGVPSLQGVFHPNYQAIHTGAAALKGDIAMVIKGEGGEFEVNPERRCLAAYAFGEQVGEMLLPSMASHYSDKVDSPKTVYLQQLWQGELDSSYALRAVIDTAALALCAIRQNSDIETATNECEKAWASRTLSSIPS